MPNINESLMGVPIFKTYDEHTINKLAHNSIVHEYEKGKILFIHSEDANYFYFVQSGWVKLFRETLDGSQAVVDILPKGHIFGETSIFENNTYPYSAEVVERASVIAIPLNNLKSEIEANSALALDMLRSMAHYRRRQDREIEHRAIQNAPQRIGCFMLRLIDQNETGPVILNLPYDKTLLASRLGMQPETFSRALSKLRAKTGIEINGSTIKMKSVNQLVNYSCAMCSSTFPCKDLKAAE